MIAFRLIIVLLRASHQNWGSWSPSGYTTASYVYFMKRTCFSGMVLPGEWGAVAELVRARVSKSRGPEFESHRRRFESWAASSISEKDGNRS